VNLPPINKALTASQLRDRVLATMNGESRALSEADRKRRQHVLEALRKGKP
jgi:hypothetical protein